MVTRLYFNNYSYYPGVNPANYPAGSIMPMTPLSSLITADIIGTWGPELYSMMTPTKGITAAALTAYQWATQSPGTRNYYIARFVSPLLNQTSISAGNWTYGFGASEYAHLSDGTTPMIGYFPVSGKNKGVWINLYVWRPSTGTKYDTIFEGNSSATVNNDYPHALAETYFHVTNFSGKAVPGLVPADAILIMEVWFVISIDQPAKNPVYYYFIDGTMVYSNDAQSPDPATYLETNQTLYFIDKLVTSAPSAQSVTVNDSAVRTVTRQTRHKEIVETTAFTESLNIRTVAAPADKQIIVDQETVSITDQTTFLITRAVPLNKQCIPWAESLEISDSILSETTVATVIHTGDSDYMPPA